MAQDPKNFLEITIGNVVTWIGILLAGAATWFRSQFNQESMSKQLAELEREMKENDKSAVIVRQENAVTLTRIEDRLDNYHTRIRKAEETLDAVVRMEAAAQETKRMVAEIKSKLI